MTKTEQKRDKREMPAQDFSLEKSLNAMAGIYKAVLQKAAEA